MKDTFVWMQTIKRVLNLGDGSACFDLNKIGKIITNTSDYIFFQIWIYSIINFASNFASLLHNNSWVKSVYGVVEINTSFSDCDSRDRCVERITCLFSCWYSPPTLLQPGLSVFTGAIIENKQLNNFPKGTKRNT